MASDQNVKIMLTIFTKKISITQILHKICFYHY